MTAPEPFRILVADDEPMLLDSYRYVIDDLSPRRDRMTELEEQLFGPADAPLTPEVEICCVRQGEAAVAQVHEALSAGRRFGAAFLDVRMPPGISGLEAAKRIRALDSLINIVIVSGFTGVDARKITRDVPPADRLFFLAKPFQARELQQYVLSFSARLENDRRIDAGEAGVSRRSCRAEEARPTS
jgi:two-component system cell cycle sensor histidine kinase/response regulator CckA